MTGDEEQFDAEPPGGPEPEGPGTDPHDGGTASGIRVSQHLGFSEEEEERPSLSYGAIVSSQFRKNRVAVFSLWLLGLLFLVAVYAPFLSFRMPFVYVDDLRQNLREGDEITLGKIVFDVTTEGKEPAPAPREKSPEGKTPPPESKTPSPKGKEAPPAAAARSGVACFYLRSKATGETMRIQSGLSVGASKACSIHLPDAGLAEKHAAFGLIGGVPYIVDVAGSQTFQLLSDGDRVEVDGEAYLVARREEEYVLRKGEEGEPIPLPECIRPGRLKPSVLSRTGTDLAVEHAAFGTFLHRPYISGTSDEGAVEVNGKDVGPHTIVFLEGGDEILLSGITFKVIHENNVYIIERRGSAWQIPIQETLRVGRAKETTVSGMREGQSENLATFGLLKGRPFVVQRFRDAEILINGKRLGERDVKVNGEPLHQTSFPFFRALFDKNEFEMGVDRFFNFMIFALPP
ncbi:MAG: FHA domain-containing protein, partial [Planctomycetota bacterium]